MILEEKTTQLRAQGDLLRLTQSKLEELESNHEHQRRQLEFEYEQKLVNERNGFVMEINELRGKVE